MKSLFTEGSHPTLATQFYNVQNLQEGNKKWASPGLETETLGYCHSGTCCHHQTVDRAESRHINTESRGDVIGVIGEKNVFTGGLNCETNDFVTLVKPCGGMAAWVITVRQRGSN